MANLWNPLYLPYGSLTNWYDSTDTTTLTLSTNDTVANWRDKSYDANNLSETDFADLPTYGTTNLNGLSTVDFDASTAINLDNQIIDIDANNIYTIYVGRNNAYTPPASTMFNFTGNGFNSIILRATSDLRTQFLMKDAAGSEGVIANIQMDAAIPIENTFVYTTNIQAGSATLETNYNGDPSKNGGSTIVALPRPIPTLNKLTLGAQNGNPDLNGLNGQIGEFVVASNDITTEDKQKLEGYTAWKWGQQTKLPDGHPYEDAAPTVTDVEFRNKLYETSTEEGSSRFRRLFALGYVG